MEMVFLVLTELFQSTLPARGATKAIFVTLTYRNISIHAPREGSDRTPRLTLIGKKLFQSTLPARGATPDGGTEQFGNYDFNPRSPRGERPPRWWDSSEWRRISIHAPREGSDPSSFRSDTTMMRFQSTLPARGATTRPPCNIAPMLISIHAPREGSDAAASDSAADCSIFQSTLPARGATRWRWSILRINIISIHAPREGSDMCSRFRITEARLFQSTLPARGATLFGKSRSTARVFQSTLPARGATDIVFVKTGMPVISIHAPREGSDLRRICAIAPASRFQSTLPARGATGPGSPFGPGSPYFNPRSPRGERPAASSGLHQHPRISIHAPREGSDAENWWKMRNTFISIHAPREGSDQRGSDLGKRVQDFNPRSPRGERPLGHQLSHGLQGDFNPRSPRGERPDGKVDVVWRGIISIHAPREGSDAWGHSEDYLTLYFNPRSPRGERPAPCCPSAAPGYFNPRSPRGERR